ncbi:MAG: sugar phosphate isomerase/epimerase [Phycisphaerales bacterium]|jgi:L-ribulose-5-phosphate 3-epimerase|nr:sugar phosphate isomerase/epimerase [Phycisphaerales bacterium]MBT7170529.1 sugar phosphate isomerase/epimerase [Phycisphaerales bacterium]
MTELKQNIAVCSWSLQPSDADDLVAKVQAVGVTKVQLALNDHRGSAGGAAIAGKLKEAGIEIVSGMFGTVGEDYSSLDAIRETGGIVPDATWEENLQLAKDVADSAADLGLSLVTFHGGFLPEDTTDPTYAKLSDRLKKIAEVFAAKGINVALETGQEEASHLAAFLDELAMPNVGVNFDPANMILYAKGDPVEGLRALMPHVMQIHLKDACWTKTPGEWGSEVVIGTGEVDWVAFLDILKAANFDGAMAIEREAGDTRVADITAGREFVEAILAV